MAVIRDCHHPRSFQRTNRRQFLAGDVFGDGSGNVDVYHSLFARQFVNQGDGPGIIDWRSGVWHAYDRGEPASGSGRGTGGYGFFGGLAGFAQVDVQIDEARTNDEAFDVQSLNLRGGFQSSIPAKGGNFSVVDQQVRDGIEMVGGINDSSSSEQQRVHGGQSIQNP